MPTSKVSGNINNIGTSSFQDRNGANIESEVQRYADLMTIYGKKSAKAVSDYRTVLEKKALDNQKKDRLRIESEIAKASNNVFAQWSVKFKESINNLGESLTKLTNKLGSSIDSYINFYTQNFSAITTRLQGSGLSFDRISANISRNLGTSPYLRQTDMINNLNKFVQSGIAFNVESRAYIATATDKIATTFDAFDSSLLRLIRIQQADTTVARVGMESLLTKFLNARYEDTSYLSRSARTVSAALTEAQSLMGYRRGTEFEYAVQQWLGSMGSLGVSENTLASIATGLGYLGSGNVSALASNTGLQNLLVMAASRAGLDYGSLLTGGLTPSTTSRLLSSIVGLGQSIAGSGNNVVMSQYASLFGLSVSDIVSLTNLTASDLKEISSNIVTYEQMRNETVNQLATMGQRSTTSEKIANIMANVTASLGANVATNPVAYGIWQAASLLASSGLDWGINLGFLGTGTSTNMSTLLKTGVIGFSAVTSLANALSNLSNSAGTSLSAWGGVETRGSGLATTGISGRSVSSSSYIGSLDSGYVSTGYRDLQEETTTYTGEQEEDKLTQAVDTYIKEDVASIRTILESWDVMFKNSLLLSR